MKASNITLAMMPYIESGVLKAMPVRLTSTFDVRTIEEWQLDAIKDQLEADIWVMEHPSNDDIDTSSDGQSTVIYTDKQTFTVFRDSEVVVVSKVLYDGRPCIMCSVESYLQQKAKSLGFEIRLDIDEESKLMWEKRTGLTLYPMTVLLADGTVTPVLAFTDVPEHADKIIVLSNGNDQYLDMRDQIVIDTADDNDPFTPMSDYYARCLVLDNLAVTR